jgi:hypothetical protein
VPDEEDVEKQRQNQQDHGYDPDDQCKGHGRQNHGLFRIFLGQELEVDEELNDWSASWRSLVFADWYNIGLDDRPQCEGIDNHTRAFSAQNAEAT